MSLKLQVEYIPSFRTLVVKGTSTGTFIFEGVARFRFAEDYNQIYAL